MDRLARLQPTSFQLLVEFEQLFLADLAAFIHAFHTRTKTGLALLIPLIREMLKIGRGEEPVIVAHRVDLLFYLGSCHDRRMTLDARTGNY
ncbi:hypothetical protein LBMAG56_50160 [Verrucomicrobiota bacterium]|nr:hypothetical protein LBMAG56_50160 [Verrucomicrobiota bacterium]